MCIKGRVFLLLGIQSVYSKSYQQGSMNNHKHITLVHFKRVLVTFSQNFEVVTNSQVQSCLKLTNLNNIKKRNLHKDD